MENTLDLLEALEHIDPAALNYNDWLAVGMGLKEAGYPVSAWEEWSRRDGKRFRPGECERKWNGFLGNAKPVTGGTIVAMARDRGWRPPRIGHELDWNDIIETDGDMVVVDQDWIETREVNEPQVWDPVQELVSYLRALFDEGDYVGYVTHSYVNEDGRHIPSKGCFDRTAGKLIQELNKCKGDLGRVLGDYDPEAGAWIRFNPLDGKGVKNENVTGFRYALVESDTLPIETQNAIIRELELPVAALVHSGGKSLHAIVRIEADSYEEYRRRVDYLYSVCRKNGLDIDRQNRNPSRLSRMPGAVRKGRKQFLVDTNIGKSTWDEWRDWMESAYAGIRSAATDGTPVSGGGNTREDSMLSNIVHRGELKRRLKEARLWAAQVDKALAVLDDEERLVLDRFYIHRTKNSVGELCDRLNLEKTAVYDRWNKALQHFTVALYGITAIG